MYAAYDEATAVMRTENELRMERELAQKQELVSSVRTVEKTMQDRTGRGPAGLVLRPVPAPRQHELSAVPPESRGASAGSFMGTRGMSLTAEEEVAALV